MASIIATPAPHRDAPHGLDAVIARPALYGGQNGKDSVRRSLKGVLLIRKRRFHMTAETPRRRREALALLTTPPLSAYVARASGDVVAAREECLLTLLAVVGNANGRRLTLERQDPRQQARDRACIAGVIRRGRLPRDLAYGHAAAETEPILWAADIIAWAAGAGGDWWRRAAPCVTETP